MSRPKYRITSADVDHAAQYLGPLLTGNFIELRSDDSYRVAEREFLAIKEIRSKEERGERLNAWCEKHLKAKTWAKLKPAVRKRRERKQRIKSGTTLLTVSMSQKAFRLLSQLSKRDNATHSETIEFYLGKAVREKARRY